jgi:hypothetical protein
MTGQLRVLFTCRRRGHIYARIVETNDGPVVMITNTAYTDLGPKPGTVRKRLFAEEQKFALGEGENWGTDMVCGCRAPARWLPSGACEVQLREWEKYNRPDVRRVVWDQTLNSQYD